MYCIKELMWPIEVLESSGVWHQMPPVINPIFKSTPNLETPPLCQICQLACSMHCMPKVNQLTVAKLDQQGALSQDASKAGDFVSADQYIVNTPGRLLSRYGREAPHNQTHGGTISHVAAIGLFWAENWVSLGAEKLWWLWNALSNGCGNLLQLRLATLTDTMEFSLTNSFKGLQELIPDFAVGAQMESVSWVKP